MPERPASEVVPLARAWIARTVGRVGQDGRERQDGQAGQRRSDGDSPWFVWVHLFDPHAPYRPPPPFDAQYASRPYYGEVAAVDAALAPLLDELRASPRPTLVIVTGDHGEGARRSRRAVARAVRLRSDAARAADRRGGGALDGSADGGAGRRDRRAKCRPSPRGTSTSCRRFSTPSDSRRRPDLPGRSLLPAAERARGAPPRPSYFEAMGGDAQSRLGAAVRACSPIATSSSICRSPSATTSRPIRRSATNLAGRAPERDRTLAASLARLQRRAARRAARGRSRRGGATARARLRVGQRAARRRAIPSRRSEAARRSRSRHSRRGRGVRRAAASPKRCGSIKASSRGVPTWRSPIGTSRSSSGSAATRPARSTCCSAAIAAGVDRVRLIGAAGRLSRRHRPRRARRSAARAAGPRSGRGRRDAERAGHRLRASRTPRRGARACSNACSPIDPGSSVPLENLGRDGAGARRPRRGAHAVRARPCAPIRDRRARTPGSAWSRCGRASRAAAIEAWKRAVQLDPRNFDALYNAGRRSRARRSLRPRGPIWSSSSRKSARPSLRTLPLLQRSTRRDRVALRRAEPLSSRSTNSTCAPPTNNSRRGWARRPARRDVASRRHDDSASSGAGRAAERHRACSQLGPWSSVTPAHTGRCARPRRAGEDGFENRRQHE